MVYFICKMVVNHHAKEDILGVAIKMMTLEASVSACDDNVGLFYNYYWKNSRKIIIIANVVAVTVAIVVMAAVADMLCV